MLTAQAAAITVAMTTADGVDPLSGVSYTISDPNGTVRIIFPGSGSSTNNVWAWNSSISEYETSFAQTVIVTFASPVPISDIVFGVSCTSFTTGQVTLTGSATLADLDLQDSKGRGHRRRRQLQLHDRDHYYYFNPASEGGADGYSVYVGFVQGTGTPEPSSGLLLLGAAAGLLFVSTRFR